MISIEKRRKLKECIQDMCENEENCEGCHFYDPEDATDNACFCLLRDYYGNAPNRLVWDMNSAMSRN